MKIIVLGTQATMNRLDWLLCDQAFEVVSASDSLDKLSHLLPESAFDMAIVQAGLEVAQNAFHLINARGIPVIFIVGTKDSDWEKLKLLDAYACIPEEAGEAGLVARMRAVLRRLQPAGQTEKSSLVIEPVKILIKS